MNAILQDLRYSLRSLRRSPVLTIVALLSLALGIGANTAIFSLMDQALLRPLPVRNPSELVLLSATGPAPGSMITNYDDKVTFSYLVYCDFRDSAPAVQGVLARAPSFFSVSWRDATERVYGELVSGTYFDVLGVHAALGRAFTPDDDRVPGAHPVVVLSYLYWKNHFAGDPQILNQKILVNGHPMTVIGVSQPGFHSVGTGEAPDLFIPMMMRPVLFAGKDDLSNRRSQWLNIFARLKPGVTRPEAQAAADVLWKRILENEAKEIPARGRARFLARRLSLLPAYRGISGAPESLTTAMTVLMCMVGLLLLIACARKRSASGSRWALRARASCGN
jgi:putative ABC transport system permease protein